MVSLLFSVAHQILVSSLFFIIITFIAFVDCTGGVIFNLITFPHYHRCLCNLQGTFASNMLEFGMKPFDVHSFVIKMATLNDLVCVDIQMPYSNLDICSLRNWALLSMLFLFLFFVASDTALPSIVSCLTPPSPSLSLPPPSLPSLPPPLPCPFPLPLYLTHNAESSPH